MYRVTSLNRINVNIIFQTPFVNWFVPFVHSVGEYYLLQTESISSEKTLLFAILQGGSIPLLLAQIM